MIYRAAYLQSYEWPHDGPADTFEHHTGAHNGRHGFLKGGFWTTIVVARTASHLSACMGVACTRQENGMRFCQTLNGWPSVNRPEETAL